MIIALAYSNKNDETPENGLKSILSRFLEFMIIWSKKIFKGLKSKFELCVFENGSEKFDSYSACDMDTGHIRSACPFKSLFLKVLH